MRARGQSQLSVQWEFLVAERLIEDEHGRKTLLRFIEAQELPFSVNLSQGKRRSLEQNKLQRMWMSEIAEQLGDRTPEDVRGECKLTFGVPILRAENEKFRAEYDRLIRPMPYESKVALMKEPIDFPVTRLMTSKQKAQYLDAIVQHYSGIGVALTVPEGR
jgi:hypothetical protein